jgi:hypothetical protein
LEYVTASRGAVAAAAAATRCHHHGEGRFRLACELRTDSVSSFERDVPMAKRARTNEGGSDGAIGPAHAIGVLTQLLKMQKDGSGTDLVVLVDEMHGCVRMCGSEFFRTQLQTGVGASSICELTLPEMSASAFELIVECLYTGVLAIDDSNVMELLEASKRMQVGIAEAQCCEWLEEHIDVSNAVLVWESARRIGCERVTAKAWPLVGRHLQEVARHESSLTLPQRLLVELLSDDSLAVRSDVTVYEAVMGWVRMEEAGRKGAIGEVLRAVRLGRLPAHYLRRVAADSLVIPNTDAKRLMVEVSCAMYRRRDRCSRRGLLFVLGGDKPGMTDKTNLRTSKRRCRNKG